MTLLEASRILAENLERNLRRMDKQQAIDLLLKKNFILDWQTPVCKAVYGTTRVQAARALRDGTLVLREMPEGWRLEER